MDNAQGNGSQGKNKSSYFAHPTSHGKDIAIGHGLNGSSPTLAPSTQAS